MPSDVSGLFDNGHCAQATFEAFKYVDEEIQRISGNSDYGSSLMMKALGGTPPSVKLNPGMTKNEQSEQEGYKFLFCGAMLAIRNPRGHKSGMTDDPDTCLDHLSFASMLLRRLDEAGLR
ncbi:MAG: TIGR02391 family protein [Actinobacteria bacterium]|nr:TIGR02391 family protein [Actinomycetota bacterium]